MKHLYVVWYERGETALGVSAYSNRTRASIGVDLLVGSADLCWTWPTWVTSLTNRGRR